MDSTLRFDLGVIADQPLDLTIPIDSEPDVHLLEPFTVCLRSPLERPLVELPNQLGRLHGRNAEVPESGDALEELLERYGDLAPDVPDGRNRA